MAGGACGWPEGGRRGREGGHMGAVIGDLLPLGLSVAISPIPIVAVILMLLSGQAARTSTGFLGGWVAGIVAVTVVVLVLVGQAGNTSAGQPSTASSVLKLVFGVLALALAVRQWRGGATPGGGGGRAPRVREHDPVSLS